MWDICKQVLENNRRELTLTGADIDKYDDEIATSGLFTLVDLNLLRICKSSLTCLPETLGKLINLTNLVCQLNKLETFPASVGSLTKLTLLDVSSNQLKELPNELGNLEHLASLNVSCNQLKTLPCLKGCKALAHLDASHNQLESFLDIGDSFEFLADLILSNNSIGEIPGIAGRLASLKNLELENNKILEVPGNLSDCPKIKVVSLCGNALKDRRLRKLVENKRTQPDQVMKYIKQHCPKVAVVEPSQHNGAHDNKENESSVEVAEPEVPQGRSLLVTYPSPEAYVTVTKEALALRPHLVCCIVSGVDLTDDKFKKFIILQNKLHEGVCGRRMQSTIATHDMAKIKISLPPTEDGKLVEGLKYTTQPKNGLIFLPLNRRSKPVTAGRFLATLQQEAENQRKQQKSNSLSGLYKYLQLVEGWQSFPCLLDASDTVLSVPPLTNADVSKISPSTTEILLEVTSDKSLAVCKATMTELLQAVLDVGPTDSITVQQVRVQGEDGGLRCVFPASDDLTALRGVRVVRPTKEK